jgi:hypothetical protein
MSGRSELDRRHRLSSRDLRMAEQEGRDHPMLETHAAAADGMERKGKPPAERSFTIALPPPPAVDAVEQRADDDRYQHAHHDPHRVGAGARAVRRRIARGRRRRAQQPALRHASTSRDLSDPALCTHRRRKKPDGMEMMMRLRAAGAKGAQQNVETRGTQRNWGKRSENGERRAETSDRTVSVSPVAFGLLSLSAPAVGGYL